MKLSDRGASQTPAESAKKVLQVEPVDDEAESPLLEPRPLGLRNGLGCCARTPRINRASGKGATAAHLALVWGGEQVILPALDVSDPVFEYGAKATATDLFHHFVCATATGIAYAWLEHSEGRKIG